jgi:hypothetical protein
MKKKRHRVIDPRKARAAAGGGGGSFYDRIMPSEATRTACSKCRTYSTLIGADGECLKCRLQERAATPGSAA